VDGVFVHAAAIWVGIDAEGSGAGEGHFPESMTGCLLVTVIWCAPSVVLVN
jgi:hypothetical protein